MARGFKNVNFIPALLIFGAVFCSRPHFYSSVLQYEISDDLGLGRIFDGIGGLSGGGATSKLLINYKEPQRSQILDYLFKPKFGASLQSLKVEIGGDDQSTDGTEASHMHEEWEENYNRGYEWWLMKEAKKRNPNIKLLGLSWAWPHWLNRVEQNDPYKDLEKTAMYTIKWILGAKYVHNLTIDYIGIWNERPCDFNYILTLKRALFENKLENVKIIGCDGWWDTFGEIRANKSVAEALYAFGVHYPGATSPKEAIDSNMTLWASEDYSTFNDEIGAGCWARVLNQNYANGYMTSTISWNLIASYYFGLPYEGDGLMTAVEPWSGHYEVKSPIWISAHTTQFTEIGWKYLKHGRGVGLLEKGGSYVSLTDPNNQHLTIVIETMTRNHSICIRPFLPDYNVSAQKAVFKFGGQFAKLDKLYIWKTKLRYDAAQPSSTFENAGTIQIVSNRVSLNLEIDSIYTLTTVADGKKGDFDEVPKSSKFPLPYEDDFQNYSLHEEPYNLAPQIGTWEILQDPQSGPKFARQMVTAQPVAWCDLQPYPFAIIGDQTWSDMNITVKVRLPKENSTQSVFVGLQTKTEPCSYDKTSGIFLFIDGKLSNYAITTDLIGMQILDVGPLKSKFESNKWYTFGLIIRNQTVTAIFNDNILESNLRYLESPKHYYKGKKSNKAAQQGFASLGSSSYGYSDWGHLYLNLPA